jgi:hypothetical protein
MNVLNKIAIIANFPLSFIPGNRTMQHFNKPEDPNRFLTTELYRRQPTNLPGQLNMSYGRPAEGYYALRNPSEKTVLLFH